MGGKTLIGIIGISTILFSRENSFSETGLYIASSDVSNTPLRKETPKETEGYLPKYAIVSKYDDYEQKRRMSKHKSRFYHD